MQTFVRSLAILSATIWLTGCVMDPESASATEAPLSDDTAVSANSGTSTATNNQTEFPLGDDALVAPLEPLLEIQPAPGALNFTWHDRDNDASTPITEINLYEFDFRTEVEVAVDTIIDPSSSSLTVAVTPHQLAWESVSYRVEICTQDNCLSSARKPIKSLLSHVVAPITSANSALANSFGDQVALSSTGNVAVVTSPEQASALIFFHVADQWIQASILASDSFIVQADSTMRVAVSASGDTVIVATISSNTIPKVVVFDRLGENWVETNSIVPIATNDSTLRWNVDTLAVALSDNGNRLAIAAQSANQAINALPTNNNRVAIFDRGVANWVNTANLTIPLQNFRLPKFSSSATLDHVFTLSELDANLYLHEHTLSSGTWATSAPQFISEIIPSIDNVIVSSGDGRELAIAGWEIESDARVAAVAWRFQNIANLFIASDSVRLPPVALTVASLRLAADAELASIAIGWQAPSSANLAFYGQNQQRWQHLFSVPDAFSLTRNLPLADSVAISADNSTALIGTRDMGNGGLVSAFR